MPSTRLSIVPGGQYRETDTPHLSPGMKRCRYKGDNASDPPADVPCCLLRVKGGEREGGGSDVKCREQERVSTMLPSCFRLRVMLLLLVYFLALGMYASCLVNVQIEDLAV